MTAKPPEEGVDYLIDVSANGDTLWVNGPDSCIARFSKRFGVDVHRSAAEQLQGAPECIYCTHAQAGAAEWEAFRSEVLRYHRIDIPADALSFDAPEASQ